MWNKYYTLAKQAKSLMALFFSYAKILSSLANFFSSLVQRLDAQVFKFKEPNI